MAGVAGLNWIRIMAASFLAESLPILLLTAIVTVYSLIREPTAATPDEFAPQAGMWVGPIGGFLSTLVFAWWAARRVPGHGVTYGSMVGIATALLDFGLGILLGGEGAIQPIFLISNAGRILAGVLGGWMAKTLSKAQGA